MKPTPRPRAEERERLLGHWPSQSEEAASIFPDWTIHREITPDGLHGD